MEYSIKGAFHTHNSPSAYAAGVTVVVLCVCVCYHIFGDIAHVYVTTTIAISFARYAPDFYKCDSIAASFCS